ncbi:MAG TPA: hypothetical protein DCL44_04850 [Elusimicrobia bacterium]|nr:hypothetical protein [Elusimicrobiota bacterium]
MIGGFMENEPFIVLELELTRKRCLFALTLAFLCFHPRPLGSETLTLTTYYPAPYGAYVSLLTTQQTLLARDGGSVGIGTSGPLPANVKLSVHSGTTQGNISISGVSDSGATYSSLQLNDNNLASTNAWGIAHKKALGTVEDNDFQIVKVNNGVATAARLAIDNTTGNVGIGTNNPLYRFDVSGDARVTGALRSHCTVVWYSGTAYCPATYSFMGNLGGGASCISGGQLFLGGNINSPTRWVPHREENCTGNMLCCRMQIN